MTGRIIGGAFLSAAGLAPAFLGLLFMVASSGRSSRLIAGIAMAAAGIVMLVLGLRLLRKGLRSSPAGVRRLIFASAAKHNGLVSAEVLFAAAGDREHTEQELAGLSREGRVKSETVSGKTLYLFPEFQFELKMKVCPYCGRDFPVRETLETCPSCGGDLKIKGMKTSEGGGKFSLDE